MIVATRVQKGNQCENQRYARTPNFPDIAPQKYPIALKKIEMSLIKKLAKCLPNPEKNF